MNEEEKKNRNLYITGRFYIPVDEAIRTVIIENGFRLKDFVNDNGSLLEFPKNDPPTLCLMSNEELESWKTTSISVPLWESLVDLNKKVEACCSGISTLTIGCHNAGILTGNVGDTISELLRNTIDHLLQVEEKLDQPKPESWYKRLFSFLTRKHHQS